MEPYWKVGTHEMEELLRATREARALLIDHDHIKGDAYYRQVHDRLADAICAARKEYIPANNGGLK